MVFELKSLRAKIKMKIITIVKAHTLFILLLFFFSFALLASCIYVSLDLSYIFDTVLDV